MDMKITIPTELADITLEQYQKYLKLVEANDEVATQTHFFKAKIIEIFCNIPFIELHNMKVIDVDEIVQTIYSALEKTPQLINTFKMGDQEFGFIPKLDDMTFGEYVDLDTYIGKWDQMNVAMSVLYRPITAKKGHKYLIEDYRGDNYHDIMKQMPLSAVFGSIVFFYHLGIDCSKDMMTYLATTDNNTELGKALDQSGVGINQYTHSLKEILDDLKVSLN
jgi:hypothetical protein